MEFFLMSAPEGQGSSMGFLDLLVPFLLFFVIMYLFVFWPQRREQKKWDSMVQSLKKGDVIVTKGGIIGRISKIKDDRIELKVDEANNTKIHILRSAILMCMNKENEEENKEKEKEKKEK